MQGHWGAIFAINSYHVIYQLLGHKINICFSGKDGVWLNYNSGKQEDSNGNSSSRLSRWKWMRFYW